MATAKKTETKETTIDLQALKAELKAELQAEMKAEAEKIKEVVVSREKDLDKQAAAEQETTLQKLKKQRKVPITIPFDPLNSSDVEVIGINGVIYSIPRGKPFMVPESIYNIWAESYEKTQRAQRKMAFNNVNLKEVSIRE